VAIQKRLQSPLDFGRGSGEQERMTVEPQRPAAGGERRTQDGLAFQDVGGIFIDRNVVDIQMRIRVVAKVGADVQPEIEDVTEAFRAELHLPAFIDETGDGNFLVAKRS
jgi:hypothetical protein